MHNTYHRVGHGPHAVIVLHGWFGDAHAFAPMETALDGAAFSYVFMDNRGYGGMRGAAGQYSMDEVARDALALADALGFATFSVVGHSMGGMAFDGAARQLFLDASDDVQARRAIIDRSTGGRLSATWLDWKATYSWESADQAAFAAYFLVWSETDFSGEVQATAPKLPLLALVGEHDPRFDADLMRRTYLARYPQARLEVLGNAGHYPMNETPLALAASIEAFLTEKD